MKRLITLLFSILLLTACTGSQDQLSDASPLTKKSPRIPKVASSPKLPQVNLQANVLGVGRTNEAKDEKVEVDMEGLIDRIDQRLEKDNITDADLERGWYYSSESDRKWGTPQSWVWIDEGATSHWISSEAIERAKDTKNDKLCRETGGYYVISCIERDLPHCEAISQSECRCPEDTKWAEAQGCILVDRDNNYVRITDEELNQGWYFGGISQKKIGTPPQWVWFEKGFRSRWQSQGAL